MTSVIATLFEGDYHKGLGALVNSLYQNGFRGYVYAGYRGELPPWAKPLKEAAEFAVAEGCWIRFIKVDTPWHLTNYKPSFMLDVWDRFVPEAQSLFYFDPDIVIKCQWSFFEEWAEQGVALVADGVMNPMPPDHPYRKRWISWAKRTVPDYKETKNVWSYYNAGFVGFSLENKRSLSRWKSIVEFLEAEGIDLGKLSLGDRNGLIAFPDQDAMNIMTMEAWSVLSTMGPEGMDFAGGGTVMSHAAGGPKPWRKRFVPSALGGKPPILADKGWLANSNGPIQVLTPGQKLWKTLDLKVGAAIGRFVRRT